MMAVYWTIFIYTTIVSLLFSKSNNNQHTGKISDDVNYNPQRVGVIGSLLSFAVLIFFMGIRSYVADTSAYISSFETSVDTLSDIPTILMSDDKGVLFKSYMVFFKNCISNNYTDWLMSLAIFHGFAVSRFFGKYSDDFGFSCYLFIADGAFTWMQNGIRQFTAVCVILLAIDFLFKKRRIIFCLFVIIAFYIHTTAIIWLIFAFIVQGEALNKKVIFAIVGAVLCVLFVDTFTNVLGGVLESTNYADATSQFEEDDGVNPITTLIYSIPVIIAVIKRKFILSLERPLYIDTLINMSCVVVAISLIGNFTSGILFGRLPVYFSMGNFIILPWLINNCFDSNNKSIMKFCCYAGYFVYFWYYMYIYFGEMKYYSVIRAFNC